MLTQKDLSAIRGVVQEELIPVKKDINTIKKDLKRVKKVVEDTSDFLDREILADRKRVDILEKNSKLNKSYI